MASGKKIANEQLRVGYIAGTHGLRGEVRVGLSTDFPEKRFKKGASLLLTLPQSDALVTLTVQRASPYKLGWLVKFCEASTLSEVEKWKGGELWVLREWLHDLDEGEYYHYQIVGCRVETMDGSQLGEIREIHSTGANDVWIVRGEKGEFLIPYIADVVKEVRTEERLVRIDPLPGLLGEEA